MIATLVALVALGSGQGQPAARPAMKTYQFAMFKAGKSGSMSEEASGKAMQEHLTRLEDLWLKQGKAVLLGPMADKGELRGILVLDTTAEDAKAILNADPFVKAGAMTVEIKPWMAAEKVMQKPPKFMDLVPYTLGFYKRAKENLPQLPEEEGNRLQAAHIANNDRMRALGHLVWAGPFLDDGSLRGVLIFRTTDIPKLEELIKEDPLVKAGRLTWELHPALTAKGAFPDK